MHGEWGERISAKGDGVMEGLDPSCVQKPVISSGGTSQRCGVCLALLQGDGVG